jgi:hypothetical protein
MELVPNASKYHKQAVKEQNSILDGNNGSEAKLACPWAICTILILRQQTNSLIKLPIST